MRNGKKSKSSIVFHHGALGDAVLIWPLLRAIGAATLITPWSKAKLATKWIDNIAPIDGDDPKFSKLFAPDADDPCELGNAQQIISFISDGNDAWAANIHRMSPDAQLCFVQSRPQIPDEHIVKYHQRQLSEQGFNYEPAMPVLRTNPNGPIVIHPGSGGRDKCWPIEKFDVLIEQLDNVVVVVGEVEAERMDQRWLNKWNVRQPRDYIELSDLLCEARMFIGNDSGPTHLAAQLGIKTVALFGPTDPRIWSPLGPGVTTLAPDHPRTMDWLEVEDVFAVVNNVDGHIKKARPGKSTGPRSIRG